MLIPNIILLDSKHGFPFIRDNSNIILFVNLVQAISVQAQIQEYDYKIYSEDIGSILIFSHHVIRIILTLQHKTTFRIMIT